MGKDAKDGACGKVSLCLSVSVSLSVSLSLSLSLIILSLCLSVSVSLSLVGAPRWKIAAMPTMFPIAPASRADENVQSHVRRDT